MTRGEIQAFFPGQPVHFGGLDFEVPTLAWLTGPFWSAFKARLWNENLDKWRVRWECRDFARAYACMAHECWALTTGVDSPSDALAVGEIWFLPDPNTPAQGHAICPAITDKGLIFIEPQTGLTYPVGSAQRASAFFLRF